MYGSGQPYIYRMYIYTQFMYGFGQPYTWRYALQVIVKSVVNYRAHTFCPGRHDRTPPVRA